MSGLIPDPIIDRESRSIIWQRRHSVLEIVECTHPHDGRWVWRILDKGSWFMGSPLDFDSPEAARAHFLQAAQELSELANRVTNSGSDS